MIASLTSGFTLFCFLQHCWTAAISWLFANFDQTSSIILSWWDCSTKSSPKYPMPWSQMTCSTKWSSIAWTVGEMLCSIPLQNPKAVPTDFFKFQSVLGQTSQNMYGPVRIWSQKHLGDPWIYHTIEYFFAGSNLSLVKSISFILFLIGKRTLIINLLLLLLCKVTYGEDKWVNSMLAKWLQYWQTANWKISQKHLTLAIKQIACWCYWYLLRGALESMSWSWGGGKRH